MKQQTKIKRLAWLESSTAVIIASLCFYCIGWAMAVTYIARVWK